MNVPTAGRGCFPKHPLARHSVPFRVEGRGRGCSGAPRLADKMQSRSIKLPNCPAASSPGRGPGWVRNRSPLAKQSFPFSSSLFNYFNFYLLRLRPEIRITILRNHEKLLVSFIHLYFSDVGTWRRGGRRQALNPRDVPRNGALSARGPTRHSMSSPSTDNFPRAS